MNAAAPLMLVRIEPPSGRREQIVLDRLNTPAAVGRAEASAVRLLTASASRFHAVLERDAAGIWWITPEPGKPIQVDGETVTERCALELGLNLQLGGDRLRCAAVSQADVSETAPGAANAPPAHRSGWIRAALGLIGLGVLTGLGWILFARLS